MLVDGVGFALALRCLEVAGQVRDHTRRGTRLYGEQKRLERRRNCIRLQSLFDVQNTMRRLLQRMTIKARALANPNRAKPNPQRWMAFVPLRQYPADEAIQLASRAHGGGP